MNGWRSGRGSGRQDMLPVELPPRTDAHTHPRTADPEPRLVAPPAPRTPLPRLALRIAVGSIGLALAAGVAVGRLTAVEGAGPVSENAPAELRIRGAGHLNALSDPEVLGAGGLLADAAAIRERLLATGVAKNVSVERALTGGVLVDVEEKRAVASSTGSRPKPSPKTGRSSDRRRLPTWRGRVRSIWCSSAVRTGPTATSRRAPRWPAGWRRRCRAGPSWTALFRNWT